MMRREINEYSLYVFDLDGTLYDQPKLRFIMAKRLISHYLLHPFSVKELLVLMYFRKVKDEWKDSSSEEDIIRKVARDKKTDEQKVSATVRKWIYDNPLDALAKTKDEKIIKWIEDLRKSGRRVVILSDYPASDKLDAMKVPVDGIYDPADPRIDRLKPSPKGLEVIMSDTGFSGKDILMIGDRLEKDGMCAEAANVDYLILPRKVSKRDHEKFKC